MNSNRYRIEVKTTTGKLVDVFWRDTHEELREVMSCFRLHVFNITEHTASGPVACDVSAIRYSHTV